MRLTSLKPQEGRKLPRRGLAVQQSKCGNTGGGVKALAEAREVCKLKYITGAAPVYVTFLFVITVLSDNRPKFRIHIQKCTVIDSKTKRPKPNIYGRDSETKKLRILPFII